MATLNLNPYKPAPGNSVASVPIDNAFDAIMASVNSIDATQFAAGRIFDPTKLLEASSVQRIADSTLGADAATMDFTSLSANFAHLLIVASLRGTGIVGVNVRMNNDSAANYYLQSTQNSAGTITANSQNGATQMEVGTLPNAAMMGVFALFIPNYAAANFHKGVLILNGRADTASQANMSSFVGVGLWNSVSAINRLTFLPDSGSIKQNSRISIYGLG